MSSVVFLIRCPVGWKEKKSAIFSLHAMYTGGMCGCVCYTNIILLFAFVYVWCMYTVFFLPALLFLHCCCSSCLNSATQYGWTWIKEEESVREAELSLLQSTLAHRLQPGADVWGSEIIIHCNVVAASSLAMGYIIWPHPLLRPCFLSSY